MEEIKFCRVETFSNPTPGPSPKLWGGESSLLTVKSLPETTKSSSL